MNPGALDGSGTIDPATLNPASTYSSHIATPFSPPTTATEFENDTKPSTATLAITSPRGIKRSRSPESYRDGATAGDDLGAGTFFVDISSV